MVTRERGATREPKALRASRAILECLVMTAPLDCLVSLEKWEPEASMAQEVLLACQDPLASLALKALLG